MRIHVGAPKQEEGISSTDILRDMAELKKAGDSYELYDVVKEEGEFLRHAGEMIFVPSAGRAGISLGGDSVWTDATSAEDAIDRYNADETVN